MGEGGTITPVRMARLFIGVLLSITPVVCFAQEQTGSGSAATGSGSSVPTLEERLESIAGSSQPLKDIVPSDKARAAWAAEVQRYADRSAELRSRCHDEIRKANRDTIVQKSAQCLRSDVLLEATHRRKQRDLFMNTAGVQPDITGGATTGIDAWLDASTAIVDGIDAGVFTTIDSLKTAKRNLNTTYRAPMLQAFERARRAYGLALLGGTAATVLSAYEDASITPPEEFVTCMETARDAFASQGTSAGTTALRMCLMLLKDAAE